MSRRRTALFAAGLLVAGLPVATTAVAASPSCGSDLAPPQLSFGKRVYIDKVRPGGEPVSVIAEDGSINVSAHGGTTHLYKDPNALANGATDLASTYANQTLNWRSTDGGRTWAYVGTAGQQAGPHTLTSTGFSDPDYAIDAGGRIYNTEIDLANVSVFSSGDDGQTYSRGEAEVTSGDRPWLTGGRIDEVYLYVNTFQQIFRSTDGGLTWRLQSQNNGDGPDAKMYIDPKSPDGLIGPHNPDGVTFSSDQGRHWHKFDGAKLGKTVDFFGAVAVDRKGNAYRAAAGGYDGPGDTKVTDGEVTFNAFNRKTMSWGTPVKIPAPKGDMLWPWVVAGDDGHVAVAWLQRLPKHPDRFEMYVAASTNAHGSTIRCNDGKLHFIPSKWTVANASHGAIHVGDICLDGTACNASSSFQAGDRRLGDFYTVNFDKDGRIFVVGGTTVRPGADIDISTSVPIFIGATHGPKLVEKPMQTKPTRPSCTINPLC